MSYLNLILIIDYLKSFFILNLQEKLNVKYVAEFIDFYKN